MKPKQILVIVLELITISAIAIGIHGIKMPAESLKSETFELIQR